MFFISRLFVYIIFLLLCDLMKSNKQKLIVNYSGIFLENILEKLYFKVFRTFGIVEKNF